jgi:hypothetical protein
MKVLYMQKDGSKLVFDRVTKEVIYGHVINAKGRSFPAQPVEQILARGYWEPVGEKANSDKVVTTLEEALEGVVIEWKN